ncbi:MAG: Calx-beta domain-containing protein [Paracoccaceae bacterium]|nr:Calx-beta domain-containing protein [Paracoccaceae bacterium]
MLIITGGEIIEGNNGFDNFVLYTATLTEALLDPVSFRYAARSGSADEEADFDSAGTILTIPAGQTSVQFSVRTVADNASEADESVKVDIFNVQGTTLANGELRATVQGVILDDDGTGQKRSVLVSDAFLVEGDAGTKQAVFEIRLSQPSSEAITINYDTRDGTARAGTDYTAALGSVTIAAGDTVATVAVDVSGDTTLEGTEQFTLVVAPTAADADELAIDFASGIATIFDDDASDSAPTLTVTGADVLEGNNGFDNFIAYTATLSEPSLSPVSFTYRANSGTGDENADFDSAGTTVTFAAGQTTAQFFIRTVADNSFEADESVHVDIFNVQGAALPNGELITTVQSVILDDDGSGQKRAVFVNDVVLLESDAGTRQAVFEISLSDPVNETITLTYETRDGTATAGSDYTATAGTVTFAAGQTVASVAVDISGDTAVEGSEKFSLVVAPISADADQLAVDFAGGVATILDDDASNNTPSLTVTGGETVEGNNGFDNFIAYTATLSEPALSPVSFAYRAVSGTADVATDFDNTGTNTISLAAGQTSVQFFVRTVADNSAEADENVQVDIFNVQGAALANGEELMTVQSVLLDDDGSGQKRSVIIQDTTIAEGDSGTKQAVFEIRLSNPSEEEIVFDFTTVEGTATSNADFQGASGQVTFAAGQTVASVAVDVFGDTASEQMESFQLVLTTASPEIEGGQTGVAATATLLDDDTALGLAPEISLRAGEIVEGNNGFDNFLTFTITLSEPSTSPVSFSYEALSGTAIVSTDFDVTANTLTIPAGLTTGQIFVRTVADNSPEEDETVVLELSNPTGALFAGGGATLSATGTILDDDTPAPVLGTPRVLVDDANALEGNVMTFTLTRIGSTAELTTGSFMLLDGTADSGSDFAGASGQFTFDVGALTTTIYVPISTDSQSEGAETLVLQLSDLDNGVFPGNAPEAYAIGTIEPTIDPPSSNIISGSEASETINGTALDEQILGFGGDDRILGLEGNDTIFGGVGLDVLNGGAGNDVLDGGAGNDRVFAEAGDDTLIGGAGDDLLDGGVGRDTILGDTGNDILRGSDGNDVLDGGDGDDTVFGGNDDDVLRGGEGNDMLDGSGGNDTIYGDAGNDTLVGQIGIDVLRGGTGEDILRGGGGDDTLFGDEDDDLMFGSAGEDLMLGGSGNDTMEGNAQADTLFGEDGNDILRGGDGFDFLNGGAGDDILAGGNGNDRLIGGGGQDTLRGQGNADVFVFEAVSDSAFGISDLIDGIDGVGSETGDLIDVSTIDADSTLGGDQSFTFLGELTTAQGLAAGAGVLWVENAGNQTRIYGSVDNDGTIDFALRVNDGAGIDADDWVADDFLL